MNTLTALRYLVALQEHRHFSRAAQASHITQPALSNAIKALEAEYGVLIVHRGHMFSGFTEQGERILQTAHRLLREHERLHQSLKSARTAPVGQLRIGAVPTALSVAARFAAGLQRLHGGIAPTVLSLNSQELEKRLQDFSLDIGLGYTERTAHLRSTIAAQAQYTERYFLASHLARLPDTQATVSWAAAARLPLCLLTPDMHNRTIVNAAFAQAGQQVSAALETNSILTLIHSVQVGNLHSVLPSALVGIARLYPDLVARPLMEPEVLTPIGLMMAPDWQASPVLEAALSFATSALWREDLSQHLGTSAESLAF